MSRDRNDSERRGGADDSARERPFAFGDGRLPPGAEGDDFERWANEHPAANDDLADLPRLRELFQSASPPEPDESAWSAALNGIRDALPDVRISRRASSRWLPPAIGLTAAAILAGVMLGRSWWTNGPPSPVLSEEPYPVVEARDVTIISMDPHDVAALVVGEPPVTGDLVFARPDDVHVIKCERCPVSGNKAKLKRGEVPMFVASVVRAEDPEEE